MFVIIIIIELIIIIIIIIRLNKAYVEPLLRCSPLFAGNVVTDSVIY